MNMSPDRLADAIAAYAADKKAIDIVALDAVCAGAGRYGVILWVEPRNFVRAGKLLGVA